MSVIESSANHPSLLEMVGTLSSYLLIVICLQHAVQWIVNKLNVAHDFQVYWISRHQIIASRRLRKIIRCCAVPCAAMIPFKSDFKLSKYYFEV